MENQEQDPFKQEGVYIQWNDKGEMYVIHDGSMKFDNLSTLVIESEKSTEVDWDPKRNIWVSELRDGRIIAQHSNRKEVVRLEHEVIATMIALGQKLPKNNWRSAVIRDIRRYLRNNGGFFVILKNTTQKVTQYVKDLANRRHHSGGE